MGLHLRISSLQQLPTQLPSPRLRPSQALAVVLICPPTQTNNRNDARLHPSAGVLAVVLLQALKISYFLCLLWLNMWAARLDPGAALFVNDYNVECGNDPNTTPERYLALIDELRHGGARVGGIGLQGHVSNPVGEVICDAFDKLPTADVPIWITELDVGEQDEGLRADNLEDVLCEAYAHPAVKGVIFWGIMQGHMWRQDAALLNADGIVNEAGQRFIDLKGVTP